MTQADPVVFVVDDDPSVCRSLGRLLKSAGLRVETFPSGLEFLCRWRNDSPCCLVADVQLPGLNGLDLQRRLVEMKAAPSVVFITGHGDIPMTVRAMKEGAVDFLTKPVQAGDLLNAVHQALARARRAREEQAEDTRIQKLLESLTSREQEVLGLVVRGMLNKQIGHRLGITEKTVKVHRSRVMEKMHARSLPDLVRLAGKAGIKD